MYSCLSFIREGETCLSVKTWLYVLVESEILYLDKHPSDNCIFKQLMAGLPNHVCITLKQTARPMKPSEFDGDHENGCSFIQSCTFYLCVCLRTTTDPLGDEDWNSYGICHLCIHLWSGKWQVAVCELEGLCWSLLPFYPLHKATNAMNQLESCQYHQRKHSVDEYINGFKELVEKAEYTDGWSIAMKVSLRY